MKSKYPNQIDTPSELPIVRDNITEITSDVINSLRSAIVQIEKTLGVNPQGDVGQTVGGRISGVIDSSGNLRPEAVDKAGIVSGPIFDDQISDVAAIAEHKLKLNFPTTVLQSEISSISSLIFGIQSEVDTLASKISAHISLEATNRHKAKAITVESILRVESSEGIKTFTGDNLQNTLQSIVQKHFNYDGVLINSDNNSHSANQIYFDNTNVSSIVLSNSVQGAMEEVAGGNSEAISQNLSYLTKNGISRWGKTYDAISSSKLEETIVDQSTISFSSSTSSTSIIFFDSNPEILKNISRFDILTISGAISDLDNRSFYINEIITDGSTGLTSVTIYGKLYSSSAGIASGKITKNNVRDLNLNGLNSTYRLRNSYTNTPDIIVANPNAATVTSFGFRPDLLTSASDSFDIKVDDYDQITISCYNGGLSTDQTIDSVIEKINEALAAAHLAAFAYKTRTKYGNEFSISHVLPNFSGDVKNRTIKISAGSSNDGTSALGISHILDSNIQGSYGNSSFINGKLFRDLEQRITLSKDEVSFGSGSPRLTSLANNFLNLDIRIGDLVVITGSTEVSDDGLFVIKSLSAAEAILDAPASFSFSGNLQTGSLVTILRSAAPISELNFEEIDETSGLMLIDVFATDSSQIFYSKRLEISNSLYSSGFYAAIVDVSKDFILSGETYFLKVGTDGFAYLEDDGGLTGDSVFVGVSATATAEHSDLFKIRSPDGTSFVTIRVVATNVPSSNLQCTIYGSSEISRSVLHLSRCLFSNATGRIFGTSGTGGIPSIIDKRNFGTIDIEQICPSFVEKYIEGPRGELRAAGIISGCGIANISAPLTDDGGGYITFDINPGVYISNGIRKEFSGVIGLKTYNIFGGINIPTYICLNEYGEVEIGQAIYGGSISYSVSPFLHRSVAYIGHLDGVLLTFSDLRFFLNNLDMKVATEIIVGKSTSLAHFTDIQSAVNYCSIFYQINYGRNSADSIYSPSILIREGEYTINSPIIIENDITISGVGKNTVLKRGPDITDCSGPGSSINTLTSIFIIGNGPGVVKSYSTTSSYSTFNFGVTIKDLTYYSPSLTTSSRTTFCLFQGESGSSDTSASFTFRNISATGAPERESDSTIAEYFLVVARISATTGAEVNRIVKASKIFITSNFMKRIGAYNSGNIPQNIAVEFTNQYVTSGTVSDIQDIICTSNICIGICPTAPSSSSSILRSSFQYANLLGIIEASNVTRSDV